MSPLGIKRGFTLIELLLVIGIIAVLASIVIVAVNPTKQLGEARNAQRHSDVNAILNAVYQYSIDHNGNLPTGITMIDTAICKSGPGVDCTGLVDLDVLTGSYLPALPTDPRSATENSTNYWIFALGDRVTVSAPNAEQGDFISVTR